MSLTHIHIIGCGKVGYTLLHEIVPLEDINKIEIWDGGRMPDFHDHNVVYPPIAIRSGLSRVDIAKKFVMCEDHRNKIIIHEEHITDTNVLNGYIIDCTDEKNKLKLISDLKISVDSNKLYLDSRNISRLTKDNGYSEYHSKEVFIKAAAYASKFLEQQIFDDETLIVMDL